MVVSWMKGPGNDFLKKYSDQVKAKFEDSKYWEYEKFLGNGAYGVTLLLKERSQFVKHQKRIALKLARRQSTALGTKRGVDSLETERQALEKVRGAKHIVSLIASTQNLEGGDIAAAWKDEQESNTIQHRVNLWGTLRRIPPKTALNPVAGLYRGPALVLEYLDGGDLLSFMDNIEREAGQDIFIPNRVIWPVFLCLIRACIGIAYPLSRPEGAPSVLEQIPAGNVDPYPLLHSDVHPRNVMIDSADDIEEHKLVGNVFKLIDFGMAHESSRLQGPPQNLFDCARVIARMISGPNAVSRPAEPFKGFATRATTILPPAGEEDDDPFSYYDPDLRDLVARCMYVDSSQRPTLKEALAVAQKGVSKTASDMPFGEDETDVAIRGFFQRNLYDVPVFAGMR
ncbi:kinase-like protein [Astrocystis sublimbata]|nr:kinase-like protein [Astrocystis sublimbata]